MIGGYSGGSRGGIIAGAFCRPLGPPAPLAIPPCGLHADQNEDWQGKLSSSLFRQFPARCLIKARQLFRKQSSQEGFHLRHIDLSVTISSIGRIECFEVWITIIDNLIGDGRRARQYCPGTNG